VPRGCDVSLDALDPLAGRFGDPADPHLADQGRKSGEDE